LYLRRGFARFEEAFRGDVSRLSMFWRKGPGKHYGLILVVEVAALLRWVCCGVVDEVIVVEEAWLSVGLVRVVRLRAGVFTKMK